MTINKTRVMTKKLIFQNQEWKWEPSLNNRRAGASAAMFEGDDQYWWVTGGSESNDYGQRTTEMYDVLSNQFHNHTDLPYATDLHGLVNVNNTHSVLLCGRDESSQVDIYDR